MQFFIEKDYHIPFEFPEDLNFSWNYINFRDCWDYSTFIKNLYIRDNQSLIVLWGIGHQINICDPSINLLNEFYESITNPMILVNGSIYRNADKIIKFPYAEWPIFQSYAKKYYLEQKLNLLCRSKKFLFASTKDYLPRKYVLSQLYKHNQFEHGYISYKCLVKDYNMERFDSKIVDKFKNDCAVIDHLLPIFGFDNLDQLLELLMIPPKIGQDCYTSIVTETFYHIKNLFFSEKIFCSMLFRHIIFYLGPAHSLEYLRSLGFKTFSHIIDESYDSIEDNSQRVIALTKSMTEFLSKPIEEIHDIYIKNIEILDHNRNLVNSIDINSMVNDGFQCAIRAKQNSV
jgi:hypothetical protein